MEARSEQSLIDHSQSGEQAVILDYFGTRIGRWLDCGAWSGRVFSNTFALAGRGWHGCAVEPSPAAFVGLMGNYAGNNKVLLVNAAIAPEPGWMTLYDAGGDAISTAVRGNTERWKDSTFTPINIWAVTPRQLLDHVGHSFDFVSIDAEGMSVPILEKMPLAEMGVSLLCIEHDNRQDRVREICARAGLTRELLQNGENILLGR